MHGDGLRPVAVVTGGSEGIGKAFASELAKAGHDLLLVARNAAQLDAAAHEVVNAAGRRVDTLALDLTTADAPAALLAWLENNKAVAELLVNSAGIGLAGKFQSHTADELHRLADLNVRALTSLIHAVLPGMLERGCGGIINVASLGGHVPGPNQAAYYASKAYVISLTEALAWETRGGGVQITAVAPGPVRTRFHANMGAERSYYLKIMGTVTPERVARAAYRGYCMGLTLVYPRLLDRALALGMRIAPHLILVPFVGWLLRKRNGA
jgi:short-subunit dehydrogenase